MDLVSSTLDKYLKHRFNGSGMNRLMPKNDALLNENKMNNPECCANGTDSSDNKSNILRDNGEIDDDLDLPTNVHHLSINTLRSTCAAIDEHARYLAVGFENSQIYLWTIISGLQPTVDSSAQDDNLNNSQDEPMSVDVNLSSEKHPENSLELSQSIRLSAHYGPVYSIEFVKNNDLMLSCSEDSTIRLWCLKTKCNLGIYRGHSYPIWTLKIGPSGEYFATGSMDTTARLWRFDKITPIRLFCGHDSDVERVEFHPNSKYIATGSSDTTVRLWSTSDGKMVRLMIGHKHPIIGLSFQPNGKFLVSADSGGTLKVWNLATNNVTSEKSVPASHTISFNMERSFISTCGRDNILRIWKLGKTKITQRAQLVLSDRPIRLMSSHFLNDKLFLLSFIDKPQNLPKIG